MRVDITYLEDTSNGDVDLMLEMIGIFSEQVDEIREEMKKMLQEKDWIKLGKLAHKMKGTVSIIGMVELAAELKNFELLTVENRDIDQYEAYVDKFINETIEAEKELEEISENLR
jgi:HPt (histidine-containing phosphotransfer) domain-containing protein